MLSQHYIDVIKKSGVSYAELGRLFKWSPNRLYHLVDKSKRFQKLDMHEFRQIKLWIKNEEARQNAIESAPHLTTAPCRAEEPPQICEAQTSA